MISIEGKPTRHYTEKNIRRIFMGFPPDQKGCLVFLPGSKN
jgi:hypothetical protein